MFGNNRGFSATRVWQQLQQRVPQRRGPEGPRHGEPTKGRGVAKTIRSSGGPIASRSNRPELGILERFEVGERTRVERVVRELQELGIRHLRTGVSWADWHGSGGEAWYDWLLPRLADEFELLPCLHHTPPSRGLVPTIQSPPRRPRDFADFVDSFLNRFEHLFETVELWNEPNNLNDWDWRIDAGWRVFAEMMGDAANWARERGKETVLGGTSPTDPNWLGMLAERGVLDLIDVVGVHAFPGSWTTVWNGWHAEVARVQEVLDRFELPCRIWITEAGFSTWRHDEVGQLRAFASALDAPADRVYWCAAEDLPPERAAGDGLHVDPRQYAFGLYEADGRPKLLARVLADGGIPLVRRLAATPERPRTSAGFSLVTGGTGFVGTNLVERLLREGKRVRVFDSLARPGSEQNLLWLRSRYGDERLAIELGDLRDPLALRRAVAGASEVFHLAAQVAVTTSLEAPLHDFRVNVEGTVRLLEEVRRLPEHPFVLLTSTNKVYGALPDIELERVGDRWIPLDPHIREHGVDEERPLDFCTPYGCSKGAADQYVLDYAKSFGLPAVVFRMSCIYGPHQHGNEDQGWVAHFLIRTLARTPITLYGDGAQVRDVLFVDDLVDAMLAARDRRHELAGRAFNIGGGPDNTTSLLELVELIAELTGRPPALRFARERQGDQRYYVSDTSAFRAATGWHPDIGVGEGVEELYRWLTAVREPAAVAAARGA
jgi:CDP-paratose 2-epimerase